MERTATNFKFDRMEILLSNMYEDHTPSNLRALKDECNKFFTKAKCKDILYTNNTDKMFFGMRVYPMISGDDVITILGDNKTQPFDSYYVELDSKLFDPMLGLQGDEYTAILLHEIGHIVYDIGTIDEVRKYVDIYFAQSGDYLDVRSTKGYKELLGYALKDAVMKTGSIFCRFNDTEIIADAFVVSCGYGPQLESAMRKITRSNTFMNKDVDDRLITLSWVLRLRSEFAIRRLPAIKTLNKAKTLTGSQLEKREIEYAVGLLGKMDDDSINEGAIKNKFSQKFKNFKIKGINNIKNDAYELNLRLRTAESPDDLLYIIRICNTNVTILRDYLNEDLSEQERKEVLDTLNDYYDIREKASKEKTVRDRYSSMINVVYPE